MRGEEGCSVNDDRAVDHLAEMMDFLREVGPLPDLEDEAALALSRERIDRWCARKPGRCRWLGLPDKETEG